MSDYPEHDKLRAIADQSQACGEFLDWLRSERGIHLMVYLPLCQRCEEYGALPENEGDVAYCDRRHGGGPLVPSHHTTEALLADFFQIDRVRLEDEKRAMLVALREGR